jgi:6-phosphogluconolactonase
LSPIRRIYADPAVTAEACAQRVLDLLDDVLGEKSPATLAISGGSTPKLMFQKMVGMKFDWTRVHLFFVDERVVPPTDDLSNFKMANENLISPAQIPPGNVHRIQGELAPEQAASAYLSDIETFFGLAAGQMPVFDVIHLGTGPDAHTASLFPGDKPLIENRDGIAAATYSESKKNWRVTLLPGSLLAARNTVYLVTGEDKAEAVQSVFNAAYDPLHFPAQLITRNGTSVEWFLDRAAARLVE